MRLLQELKNHKITALSGLGAGLEYYDFVIYIMLAPYISKALFPYSPAATGIIGVLSIFSAGYFIRPIGGVLLGSLGDRYGRKNIFLLSIALMAASTVSIGFIPAYTEIGFWAPALLLLFRTIQGFSLGAELPGAITFITEHVGDKYRGTHCGFMLLTVGLGALLSSLVAYSLTSLLSEQQMLTWGWRLPFLLGGLLGIISYYLRKETKETPTFLHQTSREKSSPFYILLTRYQKQLYLGLVITFTAACVIIFALYLPAYVSTYFGYPLQTAYLANTTGLLWSALMLPLFGALSDKIGRKTLLCLASIVVVFLSYPLFYLVSYGNVVLLFLFFILYQTLIAAFAACYPAMLAELFPTKVRYSGVAFCYNVSFSFASFSPLVATQFIEFSQKPLLIGLLFSTLATTTLIGAFIVEDKTQLPLPETA